MRRIEHLINDIRFNANQEDNNRFSDLNLLKLFNDAQRAIQAIVFMSDTATHIFEKNQIYDLVSLQEEYDLPSDIYAQSSVTAVGRAINNGNAQAIIYYQPLRQITEKELRKELGYLIRGNKLVLSPIPQNGYTNGLKLTYARKMPTLSHRIGIISSFTSGTSIQLGAGFETTDITNFNDYITVVDKDGVIKQSGIFITGYNITTGLISTSATLTGIAANDYVVLGQYATSHSELPDECEPLLTNFVERRIFSIDSSPDVADSSLFTNEEKELISMLFSQKDHDVKYPPVTDDTYINF